ncbi:MAG: PRC-barrel domain-containing protein [Hyphomicrobiales bacterium]|nr:PRC-barrel domain-containing protein [Hyphomicrobiales bacterium]
MIKTFASAAALAVILGGAVIAHAQPAPTAPSIAFIPSQMTGEVLSSGLIGEKVRNGAKEDLGDVNELVFDPDGRVAAVIIGVGGFLGIGEKNVAVPFTSLSRETDEAGRSYIRIEVTRDQLKAAPTYTRLDKGVGVTEKLKEWGARARDKAAEYGEKAREKAAEYGEKAREKAAEYGDKAREAYQDAKERVTGEPTPPATTPR